MVNLIGQRLGNYEIISRFGEGGMAAVYKARQLNIKREVAIKVILPNLAKREDFTKRFEKEAQFIASLSHPHIVKIFDYGQVRGFHLRLMDTDADPRRDVFYIVMELLPGGSLGDRLRRGPRTLPETERVVSQIGSALDYAGKQGLLHRDLKPGNILFDTQGNAFLTDFGIARLIGETNHITQDGMAMGTPSYMAPEMWGEDELTPAIDIYALGVMLFEMLAGKRPFEAQSPYRVMHMHLNDMPPSIYRFSPNLPPGIDGIINRAMAKKVGDRYTTAAEIAQELRAVMESGTQKPSAQSSATTIQSAPPPSAPAQAVQKDEPLSAPEKPKILPTRQVRRLLPFVGIVAAALIIVILLLLLAGRG